MTRADKVAASALLALTAAVAGGYQATQAPPEPPRVRIDVLSSQAAERVYPGPIIYVGTTCICDDQPNPDDVELLGLDPDDAP